MKEFESIQIILIKISNLMIQFFKGLSLVTLNHETAGKLFVWGWILKNAYNYH